MFDILQGQAVPFLPIPYTSATMRRCAACCGAPGRSCLRPRRTSAIARVEAQALGTRRVPPRRRVLLHE